MARITEAAKNVLGGLRHSKYERLLNKAENLAAQQQLVGALEVCQQIVRDLSSAKRLSPQTRGYLGRAYLAQGRIQERQGKAPAAVQSYLAAKRIVSLPEPVLVFLARQLATQKVSSEQAVAIYLEYLRLRRGKAKPGEQDPVHNLMQGLCSADDRLPAEKRARAQALCQRVLKADETIEWAQYYYGSALVTGGEHTKALTYLERAAVLNPARAETGYLINVCRGVVSEQQGNRAAALSLYRQAISALDDRPEAHLCLGRALVLECEAVEEADAPEAPERIASLSEEAVASLSRAAFLRPQDSLCHYYLGRARLYAGALEPAVQACRKALELQPDQKHFLLALGIGLGQLSDLDSAMQTVQQAIALNPDYADGYQLWGDLSLAKGERDQAIDYYRRALAINAGHVRARVGLGQALYEMGHFGDAIRELQAARSGSRRASYLLARCYGLSGQFDRAVELLNGLTARPDADAEMFYCMGCACANLGRYREAIEAFTASLRQDPSRWQAHLQRGHCHVAERDADAALQDYQAAAAAQPQHVDVMLGIVRCQLLRGDIHGARPMLERIARKQPTHTDAHVLLGAFAEKAADFAEAERWYLRALELDGKRIGPRIRLGVLCSHQGRHQQACEHLKAAAEAGVETDAVLFHLAFSLSCCGDYAGALEACLRLRQRYPDDQRLELNTKRLQYLAGYQYACSERYREAISAWEEYLKDRAEDERLKRDLSELYFRLGVTGLAASEDGLEGRKALATAQALNPGHPHVIYYRALAELVDKHPVEAAEGLAELAKGGNGNMLSLRAAYHQGIALFRAGEFERAAQVLKAVADDPEHRELGLPVDCAVALAYGRSERWEEALGALGLLH